jgi:hypothetical protein
MDRETFVPRFRAGEFERDSGEGFHGGVCAKASTTLLTGEGSFSLTSSSTLTQTSSRLVLIRALVPLGVENCLNDPFAGIEAESGFSGS